jgi:gluconate 2-dehydrogenase alpha chain
MKDSYATALFGEAARTLGYHPFPLPSANMTRAYTNPYGLTMAPCIYCGYCERFGCEMSAKASPLTAVLPALRSSPNYELRTLANVLRVNLDSKRKRAVSVTYLDARGRELEQPTELVLLTSYVFSNVRQMLLSGIGRPYDPAAGQGVVGRNYAYQCISNVTAFFEDQVFNPFMGAGALGRGIDEFNGDNFDHAALGFIGGGFIACTSTGSRPIESHPVPPRTPRWGAAWKKAVARYYGRSLSVMAHGSMQSYATNYLDLDPTYRDAAGSPLLRMTFDFHDNERRMSQHLTSRAEAIVRQLKPSAVSANARAGRYSIVPYQSTHNTGGAVMGADPATSAVNPYLQSWDVPNVFVIGASAFPQNAGYNPTGTVGALAYRAADAIRNRYVRQPGPISG